MKRLVLALSFVIMGCTLSFADNDPSFVDSNMILNRVFNNEGVAKGSSTLRTSPTTQSGTTVTHRTTVVNGDPATITADAGVNCTGYKYCIFDFSLTGTTPSFTIIPLIYNSTAAKYFQGTTFNVVSHDRVIIEVDGSSSVFMKVDTLSGTSPSATIYGTPVN